MPKKQLTAEAIAKIIEENKKNFKYSPFDFGEVSERLQNAAKKYNKLKELENATLTPQGRLVISNKKEVQTELNVSSKREYYSRASFENTFDTEIVQLLTAEPEEDKTPPPPTPIYQPPPAPTDVRLAAVNHHWSMDGKRGRTEKDLPSWKNNIHPLGNNPKGGYLIIPDDHPLFFLSHCEPKEARSSFNYEWKVDGEIVSTSPSFHMYNCSDQGQGVDDWHKENDSSSNHPSWHTHWRNQPDVMVEVRVWNESGEKKAKAPYRCAYNVGSGDNRDDDGKPLPRWKWIGTKYFREKEWMKGNYPYLTDWTIDQHYKPRKVVLRQINIKDFEETVYKRASRFAPKPWSTKQKLDVSLDKFRKFVGKGWFGNVQYLGNQSKKEHWEKAKKYDNKKDDPKLPNPYNLNNEWAMMGVIYLDDTKVTLNDLWSGYWAKGFDKYDFTNFMRLDKNGNAVKSTKTEDGSTAMERLGNEIAVTIPTGTSAKIGFKFGYKKSGDGSTKDLKYLYWDAMKTISVDKSSPEVIYVDLDATAEEIVFDSTTYNWKGEAKDIGKFKKSQAKNVLKIFKKPTKRFSFGRWL